MTRKGLGMTVIREPTAAWPESSPTATCAAALDRGVDVRDHLIDELMTVGGEDRPSGDARGRGT